MTRFSIVSEFGRPVGVVCEDKPQPGQRSVLLALIPGQAFDWPDLAGRWAAGAVLGTVEFHAEQLRRVPMLRPSGHKCAFL
jgi:hypothetical protein